jgi:undecaprenyl-diphosphatase
VAGRTAAVAGVLFLALAVWIMVAGMVPADGAVRDAILEASSPAVVAAMQVANLGGEWPVLLPATLLLFVVFARARARWWVWVGLMLTAPVAETLLKEIVGRPRPEGTALGFPSGHATAAAAFCGAVLYLAPALPTRAAWAVRAMAVLSIVLVATARIVLGAHWPSDALGGIALGLTLASLAALIAVPASPRPPRPAPSAGTAVR